MAVSAIQSRKPEKRVGVRGGRPRRIFALGLIEAVPETERGSRSA